MPATTSPAEESVPSARVNRDVVRFIAMRLGRMVVTIAMIIPLTFLLFRAVPGDPASAVIGPDIDPSVAESLRERFSLDEPLPEQLTSYIAQVATGDLGYSFQYSMPVTDVIADRLVNTAVLVGPALALASLLGVLGGAAAGLRQRSRLDTLIRSSGYLIKSAPAFWVATMAVGVLGYSLGWVPTVGMHHPGALAADASMWSRFASLDFLAHLALPLAILSLHYTVEPLLTMRVSMIGTLHEEYMSTFRAMGLPRSNIRKHAIHNAILPVVTLAPSAMDNIIGGSIIIETVFSWPGMGRGIIDAVNSFDYPMMQGIFLLTAIVVVVGNAVVDIAYGYLDPRVSS